MDEQKLEQAALIIKAGGIIIAPAEGIYGISCAYDNEQALARIIRLKERSESKGLIVISDTLKRVLPLMEVKRIPDACMMRMQDAWPSHTTFVVPAASHLPALLTGGRKTVAVRVTAFPFLKKLIALCGTPLVSTSANLSGKVGTSDLSLIEPGLIDGVDLVLDHPCQGLKGASAVYDGVTFELIRQKEQ